MNPHAYLTDEKQIAAVESIQRVDKEGYLYHMECNYDYYDIPDVFKKVIDAGCSTFVTRNLEGEVLFCRNYDFSHYLHNDKSNPRTGINVIIEGNNPKAKYRSLGVADAYWLDFKNGTYAKGAADDGKTDLSPFIVTPYICMDGINEKGLGISILALCVKSNWVSIPYDSYAEKLDKNKENLFLDKEGEEPDPYWLKASHGSIAVNEADKKAWISEKEWLQTNKEGQPYYLHPVAMRIALDNCASVDEAIAYFDSINLRAAMPGADYHIMIADTSGKSALLEWDDGVMKVSDIDHATNHYVCKDDPFFKDGCGRDECLKAGLFRTRKAGMREDFAANLLGLVVQDPSNKTDNGKTQYSCIYNLNKKTLRIYSFGDMSKYWDYKL